MNKKHVTLPITNQSRNNIYHKIISEQIAITG